MTRHTTHFEDLAAALRVWAKGLLSTEAAVELLIGHRFWLYRDDFREIAVEFGSEASSGRVMAAVDFEAVAGATVRSLLWSVPAAVPGIAFLSGGQSAELASARLNAMNAGFKPRMPWALTFSFSRAIQQPALEIWQGKEGNVQAAQQALYHRAKCNSAARRGEYNAAMETSGGV